MATTTRLAWGLPGLALAAALAALFGPQERWWGMDVGATGAAVFGFTRWTGAWLFVLLIAWAVVANTIRGADADVVEIDERDQRLPCAWWLTPLIAANAPIGLLVVRSLVEYVYLVARYARERR